jgi:hypothetical protein
MQTKFTLLTLFIVFSLLSTSLFAQSEHRLTPLSNPEATLAAMRQNGQNPDALLYVCYEFKAEPRGGENPKKSDEALYKTGLEKQTAAIQTGIAQIAGVHSCAFNYASAKVSFWVLRSETAKREVVTELSRLLDNLGFQYDLETVTVWK